MEAVIDVGVYHCGEVHDFEGDGAFLYFEGPGEAVPAAFRLRDELLERRGKHPDLPLPRISLDKGPLVIGIVGTRFRQTVALVGPAVHRGARILKLAPPGGIIATEPIVEHARRSDPALAREFERADREFVLDERHPDPIPIWIAP
jgi:class 3 adenylate cyclase